MACNRDIFTLLTFTFYFTLNNPSPPWAPRTYDFVVPTSLTHPRTNLLIVLQIGNAKDLSAPRRTHNVIKQLSEHTTKATGALTFGRTHINPFSRSKQGNIRYVTMQPALPVRQTSSCINNTRFIFRPIWAYPCILKKKKFWKEVTYFRFIRHGPHRQRLIKQFLYYCVCIRCVGNVFTEPLPGNDKGIRIQTQIDGRDLWSTPLRCYWHCGHSWPIVPASGDSEDDCG
jgi:hypothetical protein